MVRDEIDDTDLGLMEENENLPAIEGDYKRMREDETRRAIKFNAQYILEYRCYLILG